MIADQVKQQYTIETNAAVLLVVPHNACRASILTLSTAISSSVQALHMTTKDEEHNGFLPTWRYLDRAYTLSLWLLR